MRPQGRKDARRTVGDNANLPVIATNPTLSSPASNDILVVAGTWDRFVIFDELKLVKSGEEDIVFKSALTDSQTTQAVGYVGSGVATGVWQAYMRAKVHPRIADWPYWSDWQSVGSVTVT